MTLNEEAELGVLLKSADARSAFTACCAVVNG